MALCDKKEKKNLNQLQGKLCGVIVKKTKICWADWEEVLAPKDGGGFCIGSLKTLDAELLTTWIWQVLVDKGIIWCRIVRSIHSRTVTFICLSNISIVAI